MSEWLQCRNLLAVRLDNTGDLVMLSPALRAIKECLPGSRLTLLATPAGAAAAPLLPWVDDTIVWSPMWQSLGGVAFDPAQDRHLIDLLAERGFDAAVIFTSFRQTPHVPAYVCYLAGIPLRAGQSKEFGGAVLTSEMPAAPDELHQVERNLRLIESLGFPVPDRRLSLSIPEWGRRHAAELIASIGLQADQPFVVVHPGCSAPARRYSPVRFAEAAAMLHDNGIRVAVTGTERERALLESIVANSSTAMIPVDTPLAVYAALLERASAVVCGNTLPLHVCDAVGTPVVAVFAGTDLESQWRPRHVRHRLLRRDTSCHPCYLIQCPIGQPCLDIAPGAIVRDVMALIGDAGAVSRRAVSAGAAV